MVTDKLILSEVEFRKKAKDFFKKIEDATENVDPDLVELVPSQGSLILVLQKKIKIVLSLQAPVRQLWLAVAHKGEAHHFDWSESTQTWVDDKGKGLELASYLVRTVNDQVGSAVL